MPTFVFKSVRKILKKLDWNTIKLNIFKNYNNLNNIEGRSIFLILQKLVK